MIPIDINQRWPWPTVTGTTHPIEDQPLIRPVRVSFTECHCRSLYMELPPLPSPCTLTWNWHVLPSTCALSSATRAIQVLALAIIVFRVLACQSRGHEIQLQRSRSTYLKCYLKGKFMVRKQLGGCKHILNMKTLDVMWTIHKSHYLTSNNQSSWAGFGGGGGRVIIYVKCPIWNGVGC